MGAACRQFDPETIRRIPSDKIFFVQLVDAPAIDMDLLYWSRHVRNMPDEGDVAVTDFLTTVMATGFSGPISREIFNDQFRGGPPKTIAKDGYRSIVALMDDGHKTLPPTATDASSFPARCSVGGVTFIENATKGDEAGAVETMLKT